MLFDLVSKPLEQLGFEFIAELAALRIEDDGEFRPLAGPATALLFNGALK